MLRHWVLFFLLIWPLPLIAQTPLKTDFLSDSDPAIVEPAPEKRFSKRYVELWIDSLSQPEQDMQRMTAEAIVAAHQVKMPGLTATVPHLVRVMRDEKSLAPVRFAAARTLIVLNSRESAAELFELSQHCGLDLRQVIEPALAEWGYAPARDVWLKRLTDRDVRHRDLSLAIRCLGVAKVTDARDRLLEFVLDTWKPADLRMDAATALAQLSEDKLESAAERLMKADAGKPESITNRVCAVRLLGRHASPAAKKLLVAMATDPEPAVASAAMRRLLEVDVDLLLPLVEAALQNADVKIRAAASEACILRPTPERMTLLCVRLDDVNPTLRGRVRDALFELTQRAELKPEILVGAMRQIQADSWRGQEQALLLLGTLDHELAAERSVELLDSPRPEVFMTAAWALRKLGVARTFPAMLKKAEQTTAIRLTGATGPEVDFQMAHLMEAFGKWEYRAADAILRQHIPKIQTLGAYARGSAIWSLGKLNDGKPDAALAQQLIERVTDPSTMPPEFDRVRQMSSITLARLKAVEQAPRLKEFMGTDPHWNSAQIAARWAVMQLTNEKFPDPLPSISGLGFSFLEPTAQ